MIPKNSSGRPGNLSVVTVRGPKQGVEAVTTDRVEFASGGAIRVSGASGGRQFEDKAASG